VRKLRVDVFGRINNFLFSQREIPESNQSDGESRKRGSWSWIMVAVAERSEDNSKESNCSSEEKKKEKRKKRRLIQGLPSSVLMLLTVDPVNPRARKMNPCCRRYGHSSRYSCVPQLIRKSDQWLNLMILKILTLNRPLMYCIEVRYIKRKSWQLARRGEK
jgi:hypothetical protein